MKEVAFLIWSPEISGGTNVIFEHVSRLKNMKVTLVTESYFDMSLLDWFPEAKEFNWDTIEGIREKGVNFDLAIATWWRTVFSLHLIPAEKFAYFVQSIESFFYPLHEKPLRQLVEMTYLYPLSFITEASWIKEYLKDNYNKEAYLVRNGVRKEIFNADIKKVAEKDHSTFRILIEGPLGVDFKNVETAINIAKKSEADEIWLLTSSDVASYPGVHRVFSKVPIHSVGEIYCSCDVLLKLSKVEGMFGPPLEMFHCGGTAVTYNVTGYDEYIVHNSNALVSDMDDEEKVLDYLNLLKNNTELRQRLTRNAMATADEWPDWDASSKEFNCVLNSIFISDKERFTSLEILNRIAWEHYDVAEKYRLELEINKKNITLKKYFDYFSSRFPRFSRAISSFYFKIMRTLVK